MDKINKLIQPKQPVYKVIPLAFDESMSYYECICKITAKMNELISVFNDTLTQEIRDYIDERFNDIMLDSMYDPETETLILYLSREEEE